MNICYLRKKDQMVSKKEADTKRAGLLNKSLMSKA